MEKRKRKFKAKPIPADVATIYSSSNQKELNSHQNHQNVDRKTKIHLRALELLASSKLPPRMEMWQKAMVLYIYKYSI